MAGLQHRNGLYRILFRYEQKQHSLSLGKVSKTEAEAKTNQVCNVSPQMALWLSE